jgi:lipoyl-dependent peroxiredoxin
MADKVLYKATATAHGGREGRVTSDDGKLDLPLSMPKELGGSGGNGTNPEQLFAAGYAACFESALRYLASQQKIVLNDASVTAIVGIGPRDAGGFGLAVALKASLPGMERSQAEALLKTAHEAVCPYSHATRNNLNVAVSLA